DTRPTTSALHRDCLLSGVMQPLSRIAPSLKLIIQQASPPSGPAALGPSKLSAVLFTISRGHAPGIAAHHNELPIRRQDRPLWRTDHCRRHALLLNTSSSYENGRNGAQRYAASGGVRGLSLITSRFPRPGTKLASMRMPSGSSNRME